MPEQHEHPHPAAPDVQQQPPQQQPQQQPPPERRASDAAMITQLNLRLTQKAQELRLLEDREVCLAALANDLQGEAYELQSEVTGLRAMVDQVVTENKILRKRLGLPELGAIEPLPEDDIVTEPVEEQHPDN